MFLKVLKTKRKSKMKILKYHEDATTCALLIAVSLCSIIALYSFENPMRAIHASKMNQQFLRSLSQESTMDLEM